MHEMNQWPKYHVIYAKRIQFNCNVAEKGEPYITTSIISNGMSQAVHVFQSYQSLSCSVCHSNISHIFELPHGSDVYVAGS